MAGQSRTPLPSVRLFARTAALAWAALAPAASRADAAQDMLRRVAASIPAQASVSARWQCDARPEPFDVDAALDRYRREMIRNKPDDPHIEANVAASRPVYERMARGGVEVRERDYAWAPGKIRIEDRTTRADGTPSIQGLYIADGASYEITRRTQFAQVRPGVVGLAGSMTEMIYLCGVRLDEAVRPEGLKLSTAGGRAVLTGTLDFHSGVQCVAVGSRFRLEADPAAGHLPVRLQVWVQGKLREDGRVEVRRFGGNAFPGKIVAGRYRGKPTPDLVWKIEPREVTTSVDDRTFGPSARTALNVFDLRVPGKAVSYRLEPEGRFKTLEEVRMLAADQGPETRGPDTNRSVLLLRAGAFLLVGLAVVTGWSAFQRVGRGRA